MSDNLPSSVQLDTNQNGSVSFATEVISTIAGLAATEVEGVASMHGASGFADILTRRGQSAKNLTRGVKVDLTEGKLNVLVSIVIDYGSPVPEVARNIQENIKKAIETMSGLTVSNVDVHVQGVSFDKENRAAAEIEQQQRLLLQKQQRENAIGGEKAPDFVREDAPRADDAVQPEDDEDLDAWEEEDDPEDDEAAPHIEGGAQQGELPPEDIDTAPFEDPEDSE